MCLWEFSWNFWDFLSIFRVFGIVHVPMCLQYFSGICFALKIFRKKRNLNPRIGPSPWARPNPHLGRPSRRPTEAHLGLAEPARLEVVASLAKPLPPLAGVLCTPGAAAPAPIRGRAPAPRASRPTPRQAVRRRPRRALGRRRIQAPPAARVRHHWTKSGRAWASPPAVSTFVTCPSSPLRVLPLGRAPGRAKCRRFGRTRPPYAPVHRAEVEEEDMAVLRLNPEGFM
jgi:hypothetical protein